MKIKFVNDNKLVVLELEAQLVNMIVNKMQMQNSLKPLGHKFKNILDEYASIRTFNIKKHAYNSNSSLEEDF